MSKGDLKAATDWMVSQEVDVIVTSIVWTWDGPGDGTSPYTNSPLKSVDAAVDGGVIWVNAAGSDASRTWAGSFDNPNNNIWHNFSDNDECNTIELGKGDEIRVQLRWGDTWYGATRDLDLYLMQPTENYFNLDHVVASSETSQDGESDDEPFEYLTYTAESSGDYCLAVRHFGGSEPSWFQLQSWGSHELEFITGGGSISNPAESANTGMLAVGAAYWADTNTIAHYSARGPAPDRRIKPDIVGASHVTSAAYNDSFGGTSAAAPHIAGLAALVIQHYPEYAPVQVANHLKVNALRRHINLPSNVWGYGFAYLPAPQTPATPAPDAHACSHCDANPDTDACDHRDATPC